MFVGVLPYAVGVAILLSWPLVYLEERDVSVPRVVIIGGGFAGINCARCLRRVPVHVTLIDQRNFHLFQPLLYQVACGSLSPANIAQPLRRLLRGQEQLEVFMGEVTDIDTDTKEVLVDSLRVPYDFLVIAAGATTSHFGNEHWVHHAPGLKTVEDALEIRRRIFQAFEEAELSRDPEMVRRLMTFVIIGGGPTGVELAGALREIANQVLHNEFDYINPPDAKIFLIDRSERVLSGLSPELSVAAQQMLEAFQVKTLNGVSVTDVGENYVKLHTPQGEEQLYAHTIIWAAGVTGSPIAAKIAGRLGVSTGRGGQLPVEPDLTIPNHRDYYVAGDLAAAVDKDGLPVPGLAPAAIQEGKYVARHIAARLKDEELPPFKYRHKGSMATIGRGHAVAEIAGRQFAGTFAWILWAVIHLLQISLFQNRVLVLVQWAWKYVVRDQSACLITNARTTEGSKMDG